MNKGKSRPTLLVLTNLLVEVETTKLESKNEIDNSKYWT